MISGGARSGRWRLFPCAVAVFFVAMPASPGWAQSGGLFSSPPIPPAPIPQAPPAAGLVSPGGGVAAPTTTQTALPPAGPSAPTVTPSAPMVPAGQVALAVSARFGRDAPPIGGGLVWRVY